MAQTVRPIALMTHMLRYLLSNRTSVVPEQYSPSAILTERYSTLRRKSSDDVTRALAGMQEGRGEHARSVLDHAGA